MISNYHYLKQWRGEGGGGVQFSKRLDFGGLILKMHKL